MKTLVIGLVAALTIGPGLATPATAATSSEPVNPATAANASTAVTLITGDRVLVRGDEVTVAGRPGITYSIRRDKGRISVLPSDARQQVTIGRLDPRLFDVTYLLDSGYSDKQRADLPLLVSGPDTKAQPGVKTPGRELKALKAHSLTATKDGTYWTSIARGQDKIWLDGKRKISLDQSVPQIGAPAAWQAGFKGAGVTVAVIDSGIDSAHPDLAGKVLAAQDFVGASPNTDENGHGTHVASTIAGTGAASSGTRKGVAPEANLISGKVCAQDGSCYESAIIAGMEWAAGVQHAKIVNMSLGGKDFPGIDPLEDAVNVLSAQHGTLFVIAAGNEGELSELGSPGSADAALSVGAVDSFDQLAAFSGRGPRPGDGGIKPDITAPGVGIDAARPVNLGGGYQTMNGTSMAAPHVAGAAALLLQKRPQTTGPQLKATLMGTAKRDPLRTPFEQGAGRVEAGLALDTLVFGSPVNVNLGRRPWPHTDPTPISQTITYRNIGTAPVTLALSIDAAGPDGQGAPAGMFTLNSSSVTVPAGGTAQVALSGYIALGTAYGYYTGRVLATAAGSRVTTPFAVNREAESYDLTLRFTDRAGQPSAQNSARIYNLDGTSAPTTVQNANGTTVLRLPKGQYDLDSDVFTVAQQATAFLYAPLINLTTNTTIDLDARLAGAWDVTVPQAGAQLASGLVLLHRRTQALPRDHIIWWDHTSAVSFGQIGANVPQGDLFTQVTAQYAAPDISTSSYLYNLSWSAFGTFPTGVTHHVTAAELATVNARYTTRTDYSGTYGWNSTANKPIGVPVDALYAAVTHKFALPHQRTEYYNTASGSIWRGQFQETQGPDYTSFVCSLFGDATYQAGTTIAEKWNYGPFGPALLHANADDRWITRTGNTIDIFTPMYSDSAGHVGGVNSVSGERTTLSKNGVVVAERNDSGPLQATLATAAATYTLERHVQPYPVEFSQVINTLWTFSSGQTGSTQRLPLFTFRFMPQLNDRNRITGGTAFTFPFTVDRQSGVPAAALTSLTVEVSYDDGYNWQPATVNGTNVTVNHPSAAGYVSLRATATDAAGVIVVQRIVRAYGLDAAPPPAGGPNLASGKPASVSSSSGGFGAGNLNDGNQGTYWESQNNTFPQWAQIDLGTATTVARVVLKLPANWGSRAQTLTVQGSLNGSTFSTITSSAAHTFNPTVTLDFPAVSARYLRVTVTANTGWPAAQLSEFEIYGTGAPSGNLAQGKPTQESGHADVYQSARVTDGDQGTYWESASNAFPQWVQADLGTATTVRRVVLKLPAGWGARNQTLTVQGSTNGSSSTSLAASQSYAFSPGSGNSVTIDFTATSVRYVRITVTANTGWPAGQLSELEIYS